jgi:hypothetical protein
MEKNRHGSSEITDTEARTATECLVGGERRHCGTKGAARRISLRWIVSTKINATNCASLDTQMLRKNDSQVCKKKKKKKKKNGLHKCR